MHARVNTEKNARTFSEVRAVLSPCSLARIRDQTHEVQLTPHQLHAVAVKASRNGLEAPRSAGVALLRRGAAIG
eukprot:5813513-Prymnesium_polylepis.1